MMQAEKDVGDLNSLRAKRDAAAAALGKAELDLSHTRVEAPFDALVVNLHTAVGAFVTPGPLPVFALVDSRNWYVLANYRESELDRIAPGMAAEVYLMADPRRRFRGTVQGIGWAVNPEDGFILPGHPYHPPRAQLGPHRAALPRSHQHRRPAAGRRLPRRRIGGDDHSRKSRNEAEPPAAR